MESHSFELLWTLATLVAVIVVAALVNALKPQHRSRLRRSVITFGMAAAALATALALDKAGEDQIAAGCYVAAEVLRLFTLINVGATVLFAVLLPSVGVTPPMIASDLAAGVGYVVMTIGVMSEHGVNTSSAVVSGAVLSGVLAISLQSTLGNILGGVALQLDGSIHEGDWVQLENGRQGKVAAIRWRHTVIETRDWSTIIVPNALLLASNITILGKRGGETVPQRLWVWFNVDYRFPPSRVLQVVNEAINDAPIDNVMDDPKPNVVCMDFTRDMRESVATYAVRYWIRDLASDDPTSTRVRARIYTALRRAGIPLAVPAHTAFVEMHDEVRAAKRHEREIDDRLLALQTVTLFRGFTEDELRTLAAGMSHVIYTMNERITRQGAAAHWLYVMTSGTARIQIPQTDAAPIVVADIKAPDFFGEMGLMTGEPRTADVVATSDVDCFRLGKDTFEQVLLGRPKIVDQLSEKLATRRMELVATREHLDAAGRAAREQSERERILGGIKQFFGL